jgi:hypothetical protein
MPIDYSMYSTGMAPQVSIGDLIGAAQGVQGIVGNYRQLKENEKLRLEKEKKAADELFLNNAFAKGFSQWNGSDQNEFRRISNGVMETVAKTRPDLYKQALSSTNDINTALQKRLAGDVEIQSAQKDLDWKDRLNQAQIDAKKDNGELRFQAQMAKDTPETKQAALDTVDRLEATGQYGNVDWNLWRNRIANNFNGAFKFNEALTSGQTNTDEAIRKENLIRPAKAQTAAATGSAGTTARIGAEYETKKGIPGSFTQSQYAAGTYAQRMAQSGQVLDKLQVAGFNPSTLYNMIATKDATNAIRNPQQRQYAQAMRNFVNATLRRESGAAISKSEFDSAYAQYFAGLNDDPETIAQKRDNRLMTFAGFKTESGGAYDQITKNYEAQRSQPQKNGQQMNTPASNYLAEIRARRAQRGQK